jgi:NAD+ synthase
MNIKEELKLKEPRKTISKITEFIRENVRKFHKDGAVIGLSGGIDSALDAFLAVKAIGREKVLALFMPERDSHPKSKKDAELVTKTLGIELKEINITPIIEATGAYKIVPSTFGIPRKVQEKYVINRYKAHQDENETTFLKTLKGGEGDEELRKGIAYHRIKHRIRMAMWYYYGELYNYLVIGNCNKTEKLTGYFVKYGDSGSDIDPIAHLYKTQVKELARFVGVPERIIEKAPSPDLIPGITDEFALQMKYETLDQILFGLEHNISENEIMRQSGVSEKEINYVKELIKLSAHMRNLPPSPEI